MFSIIIPLYNKAPYNEKALRSIPAQTYRAFEVIVIDDGSTDIAPHPPKGGVKLAYIDLELLLGDRGQIIRQKNQGVSVARNNGVKLAKYPYICFLDADDWWAPTFLEEMKALIEEFPDAGIYGTSYYIVKNGNQRVAPIGVPEGFEKGEINYCQVYAKTLCMPLTSISICVPKTIFDSEKGFKPKLKLGEDFDLWVRIAMKNNVVLLNKPLAYYNQDVDLNFRAVSAGKFYKPEEHMLFTDYGDWMEDEDFRYLFERLALYGLLRYYLSGKNQNEVNRIINGIDLRKHERKYRLYYKILPRKLVNFYFIFLENISVLKNKIKRKTV